MNQTPVATATLVPDSNQLLAATATQPSAQVRMKIDSTLAYELDDRCDFVFLIQAAVGMNQVVVEEDLRLEPATPFRTYSDPQSGNRFLRLQAEAGQFKVIYRAVVDKMIESVDPAAPEMPVCEIPDNVLRFLCVTRCGTQTIALFAFCR